MWLIEADDQRPWLTGCDECGEEGLPAVVEIADFDTNESVRICVDCLKNGVEMIRDGGAPSR